MPFDFLRNTEFADMPDNLGHLLDHVKGVGGNECVCTITSFPHHSHLAYVSYLSWPDNTRSSGHGYQKHCYHIRIARRNVCRKGQRSF